MKVILVKNIRLVTISILTIFIACIYVFSQSEMIKTSGGDLYNIKIVIDAGHGNPDGGAISKDGVKESDLNLIFANKLKDKLSKDGFEIIMTRENENNISNLSVEESLRHIKTTDLENRVNIVNSSDAEFVISIHMNKYDDEKYFGFQTFYSNKSEKGKLLAICIQNGMKQTTNIINKREALSIEGIKIIDKTNIPAVIVECGFLSNEEELKNLQCDEYQNQIIDGIIIGIKEYIKSY